MSRYLSPTSDLIAPHRLHELVACSVELPLTRCQAPAFIDERCDNDSSPNNVYFLQRVQLCYQPVVQDVRSDSGGNAILSILQREVEVDLEVGDDGQAPGRYVAGTPPQKLYMLCPAGKHVLVSALPNDVVLRVVSAA